MNPEHLGLEILKIVLQILQFFFHLFMITDGLVDHSKGTGDELQSGSDKADDTSS